METDPSQQPERNEDAPRDPIEIYVADLAAYVDGKLHGLWIDATQDVDDIQAEIAYMLSRSPVVGSEEFAIHDYDGFHGLRLGESERLETVSRIAQGIEEHGEPYARWVEVVGTDHVGDSSQSFEGQYQGSYESMEAYVEYVLDELGAEEALERARRELPLGEYVRYDIEAIAEDWRMQMTVIEKPALSWFSRRDCSSALALPSMTHRHVACSNCGKTLDATSLTEHAPCPRCGSFGRDIDLTDPRGPSNVDVDHADWYKVRMTPPSDERPYYWVEVFSASKLICNGSGDTFVDALLDVISTGCGLLNLMDEPSS